MEAVRHTHTPDRVILAGGSPGDIDVAMMWHGTDATGRRALWGGVAVD